MRTSERPDGMDRSSHATQGFRGELQGKTVGNREGFGLDRATDKMLKESIGKR